MRVYPLWKIHNDRVNTLHFGAYCLKKNLGTTASVEMAAGNGDSDVVMKGGIFPGLSGKPHAAKGCVPVPSSVTQYECGLAFGYNVLLDFIFSVPIQRLVDSQVIYTCSLRYKTELGHVCRFMYLLCTDTERNKDIPFVHFWKDNTNYILPRW